MTPLPPPPVTPAVTADRMTGAGRHDLPLLVLGPALGTSAAALWTTCAAGLTAVFDVLAWDLPGHGHNRAVPDAAYDLGDLARGVLAVVDDVLAQRGEVGGTFAYAGVSVGGAVGLQLLLDAPARVTSAVLLCTGARIGDPAGWTGRVEQVRTEGTAGLVAGSTQRWFAPGFADREPEVASRLLQALADAADEGYAGVCGVLAGLDVRDRLGEIAVPVLAVAGAVDPVTPPTSLQTIADGVPRGRCVVLDDVAHLAPAEAPGEVAALVRQHVLGEEPPAPPVAPLDIDGRHDAGLAVRREVLGDAHVDAATAAATDLTADFQRLVTEYGWGSIWTRPGLDRRSRSLITLTALVAGGHHDELAVHLRAAVRNGLSTEEITECLLQTALYCGVPAAGTAFRVAQRVLDEMAAEA